jgi:hypothetical protein
MTTPNKAIIPIPDTKEIQKLPKFSQALTNLNSINLILDQNERDCRNLKITNREEFKKAAELVALRKKLVKQAEEIVAPFKKPLRIWLDFVQQAFNVSKNKGAQIEAIIEPKMADFLRLDEIQRQAEEKRQQAEQKAKLEREATVQRQADEEAAKEQRKARVAEIRADLKAGKITLRESKKLLAEAGADEEVALVQAKLDEQAGKEKAGEIASQTTVMSNVPTTAGVKNVTRREFTITDPRKVNVKYLIPDEVAIGRIVRDMNRSIAEIEAEIGGIKIEEKKTAV